ncbi:signal peptide-containing protein [Cryptosporidium canis]|uniref:Signal peptide-containing protein n=1 Tax=Cryptosporidium canis TaxID=195482 RepID=A0A9D5DFM3_9CRYT|nr:signal peptide-containing protein [Cryptosporidium canis]
MSSQKRNSLRVVQILICLALVLDFHLNLGEHERPAQHGYSLTEIRDSYTRITMERGSDLIKKSKDALQMAIFSYLVAQKKLSDVRSLGFHPNSAKYRNANDNFRYALDSLRMARNNWENRIKMAPIFSYKKEYVSRNKARQGFNSHDLNSLFPSARKSYSGDRGIDFQMDSHEETEPIYAPPQPQKKLTKNMINNLNLGFKFEDLPNKLARAINERENIKGQTRLGRRGRPYKSAQKDIPMFGNLNFNSKHRELLNMDRFLVNSRLNTSLNGANKLLDDKLPGGVKLGTSVGLKARRVMNGKSGSKPDLSKSAQANAAPKKSTGGERSRPKRSKGALDRDPEIPIDVAIQVEKKLGGPMNYIDLSVADLSKDARLSRLYNEYIQATLRCAQLYDSKPLFEEVFLCSRKQIDLSFKLLQMLQELNIEYTFQKNDILHMMSKFKIESIKQPEPIDRTEESEEFFRLLVNKGIFNSNNSSDSSAPNYNILADTHLANFDDRPDLPAASESNGTSSDIPDYLERYMDRFGFTPNEYLSNSRLATGIQNLAALETEMVAAAKNKQRIDAHKLFNYKVLTELIPLEILSRRAQMPIFNETEQSSR